MIVEYALSSRGFNYGQKDEWIGYSPYPYPRPVYATGNLPLLKLHGSVSWSSDSKFPDSRCGLNGECIIVPPHGNKRPREYFPQIWEKSEEILRSTKKAVFFGFAFNEYDRDIIQIISENLDGADQILIIDIVDNRERISKILPKVDLKFMDAMQYFRPSKAFDFLF
jgi:hypothetical protein